jgi:hypothetical protein
VARTGRRSAALDCHSANSDRTGTQARQGNRDNDLRGQAEAREAVSGRAVQGEVADREDHDDR